MTFVQRICALAAPFGVLALFAIALFAQLEGDAFDTSVAREADQGNAFTTLALSWAGR